MVADEIISTRSAKQLIVTGAATNAVVPLIAVDDVVAIVAEELIVAGAAVNGVIPAPVVDGVVAGVAANGVGPRPADDEVVRGAASHVSDVCGRAAVAGFVRPDVVVAVVSVQDVAAAPAAD